MITPMEYYRLSSQILIGYVQSHRRRLEFPLPQIWYQQWLSNTQVSIVLSLRPCYQVFAHYSQRS